MDRKRVEEILGSQGVINVVHNDSPVWLIANSVDTDGVIQVKNIKTEEIITVNIKDLKE